MDVSLQLNPEERELLATILRERHKQLMQEISHSDHITFSRMLRHKEDILQQMMEKVQKDTAS
jgi:small-conductance mechanosensitive channel